jgi:hypothetical protein
MFFGFSARLKYNHRPVPNAQVLRQCRQSHVNRLDHPLFLFITEKIHDFFEDFLVGNFVVSEEVFGLFLQFLDDFWALSRAGIDQPADMPSARSFGILLIGRHQPSENTHYF